MKRHRRRDTPDAPPEAPPEPKVAFAPEVPGRAALIGIFALALLVRSLVACQLWDLPILRKPWLDSLEYLDWARRLAAGDLRWPAAPPHGPGYPLFLAILLRLTGDSLHLVRLAQAVVGSVGVVLGALAGARLFGRRAGIAAGVLLGLYGPLVLADVSILGEGLLVFLLVVPLWAVTRPRRLWLASGLSTGLAVIVRPTALFVLPALAAHAVQERDRRARVGALLRVLAGCLVVTLPVVVEAWRATGTPTVQAYGGMNFYLGNRPSGEGLPTARLGGGWHELEGEARRAGLRDPVAQDRYYVRKAMAEIGDAPAGYLRLLASKLLWLVQSDEIRDTHSYYFFTDASLTLRWLPAFGVLFPLATLGLLAAAREGRLPVLIWTYLLSGAASCVLLVVGSRYRLPIVPVLALLGGAGAAAVLEAVGFHDGRARTGPAGGRPDPAPGRLRALLLPVFVLAAAVGISHVWRHGPSHNLAEELALTGKSLSEEGLLPEAEAACRRAVAADPGSGLSWDGLGFVLLKRGDRAGARAALERALALDAQNADACYHVGLLEEAEGRFERAVASLRRADELSGGRRVTLHALARTLVSAGRPAEAEPIYARLAGSAPDDAVARLGLAFLLASRGDLSAARPEAEAAASLDPLNEKAWFVLARVALEQHDVATARVALERVTGILGPGRPEVQALKGRIERDEASVPRTP